MSVRTERELGRAEVLRFHGFEIAITVDQRDAVLGRDRGDEAICSRGRHPTFSETPRSMPGCLTPVRLEWKSGHRRKPLEEAGGLFGLRQRSHQFKENPLCDSRMPIDDQWPE